MAGLFAAPEVELGGLTASPAGWVQCWKWKEGQGDVGRLTAFAGQGSTACCSACSEFSLLSECV